MTRPIRSIPAYIRSTILPSKPAQLLMKTGLKWDQDNCPGMAASLSYFALFSLFPMLLVILSVVGSLLGPNTEAVQSIQDGIVRYLPPEVHGLIKGTIVSLNANSVGARASLDLACFYGQPARSLEFSEVQSTKFGDRRAESLKRDRRLKWRFSLLPTNFSRFC